MTLDFQLLGNPLSAWLIALGIALAINVGVAVLKWLITRHLAWFFKSTDTNLDDSIVESVRRTKQWLILLVTLYVGSNYLALPPRVDKVLVSVATLAFFVQVGLWVGAFIEFWVSRYRDKATNGNVGAATGLAALNFIAKLVLWSLLLLIALDNIGVDVTALIAGLGVGGIAVALAVQNILGDLFASLSIVIDKPFVIGDFVVIDEFSGTVEHVGLKTTRIRSLGGEQIIFSNSDLLGTRVRNFKRMRERRIDFRFGVLYQTTAEQLEKIPGIVKEVVEAEKLARLDRVHFIQFGDSSLDFEVVYWMLDPDFARYRDTQQSINLALVRRFGEEGIGFAYPTRSVFVEAPIKVESVR